MKEKTFVQLSVKSSTRDKARKAKLKYKFSSYDELIFFAIKLLEGEK